MADRWKELARAERKLEEKAAKGLLKLEKGRLRLERARARLDRQRNRHDRRRNRHDRHGDRHDRQEDRHDPERDAHAERAEAQARGGPRGRPRHRDRHQARRRRQPATPEERAYRLAQRRANAKIGFLTHFVAYASVLALILVSSRSLRVTFIVAAAWGIGVAIHYFIAVIAPGLRSRLIAHEVGRSVAKGVTRERRAAETRHERSLEDLSASIAHEIRNPVTAAKRLVQQMGEDSQSGKNVEYARVALAELDRVERSISHLLRYARDEEIRFEPFQMADVVDSVVESFRDRIDLQAVELELQLDTRGPMRGDAEKMRHVLVNLIGNALDALEQSDTPVPRLQVIAGENLAGTEVWVRVRDNGDGIRPENLDKVFSPFFTTKEKGTGLGLALSKKVVDAHGGTLEVEPSAETGTEVLLTFPKDAGGAGWS
jgi:signal transduction histidine kinase